MRYANPQHLETNLDVVDWDDAEQVELLGWICSQRCPEGLSALARHVLGYDYFEIGPHGSPVRWHKKGWRWRMGRYHTCGLVAWGPHREIAKGLCADDDVLLLCSRMSMKTHWSLTSDIQAICLSRDIRIMEFMETKLQAADSMSVIQEHLEHNEKLHRLFGTFKERGIKWGALRLTVSGRSRTLRDATVVAHGSDSRSTGSRCNIFHVDDPIGEDSANNVDMIEKANRKFRSLQPLVAPGGRTVINMTPYHPQDTSFLIRQNPHMGFRVIEIPCGMEAYRDEQGEIKLNGYARFPHMDERFLLEKARKMGPELFNMNYGLTITADGTSHFQREDFPVEGWDDRFSTMNAYLMTDLALTEDMNNCMTALSIVCLDHEDVAYVMDVDCGFWGPGTVQERLIDLYTRWFGRTRIVGLVMEITGANRLYRNQIEQEMTRRGQSIRWILVPRTPDASKASRILGSQQRIHSRRLRLVDTIRREWRAGHETRVLFDPQAVVKDGKPLPGGEIVDQYLKFHPSYKGLIDIADMLAEIDTTKSSGERYVQKSQKGVVLEEADDVMRRRIAQIKNPNRRFRQQLAKAQDEDTGYDPRPIWERLSV